jgi:hypothetical protein
MKTRTPAEARAAGRVSVEIGVRERRDAVRLMNMLIPFQSYVVQYDRGRWAVHAHVPGSRGQSLDALLAAVEDWSERSGVADFTCVLRDRSSAPSARQLTPRP